jgi:DNA invertase Pin-like site-specific DNA recombinase
VPAEAILYQRVSTDDQANGLAAGLDRLKAEARRRGWRTRIVVDEGVSGGVSAEDRPHLGPALDSLKAGDILAVAKLDRLSRSVLDFARILRRAESEGWSLAVLDLGIDTTTPQGKLIAHMVVAVAQWEKEMIGLRIKEGMAQSDKCFGRSAGDPPIGGGVLSKLPAEVTAVVTDLHQAGKSPGAIADRLNAYGHRSLRGKRWHRTSVRRLLSRLDGEAA